VPVRIAAVDVGGTFTDVAVWDTGSSCLRTFKLLNDASGPAAAIAEGLRASTPDVARVIHGTTLVTNALIERRGARVGLITTDGFRDVLEIADELRYDTFDLRLRRPEPLVDRSRRSVVRERTAADGTVVQSVDLGEVVEAGRRLVDAGAEALVVAFINAHVNAANERRAATALSVLDEHVDVSAAVDVCEERGEYGRFSTAVANAYTRSLVSSYLDDVCANVDAPVFLMLSDGNIADAATAAIAPVRLVESGPAAGAVAVARLAEERGWPRVLAFDMGGTTAKVSLIHDGVPQLTNGIEVARIQRLKKGSGIPLRVPSVDLLEVGAGGGSIAACDAMGLLKVGPESAGANPGPACYGLGGEQPTVTDADLCLGYISADGLVGGRLPLRQERAEQALHALGMQLGLDYVSAAAGIVDVVNTLMASAARVHLAEHGRDPRQYTMVAFGGAGPVHACGVAEILGIPEVVFPEDAGIASAVGMLLARPGVEIVRPLVMRLSHPSWDLGEDLVAELERAAVAQLSEFATIDEGLTTSLALEMRYAGQGHEIAVPVDREWIGRSGEVAIASAFEREYARRFGRILEGIPIEVVAWRLRASTGAAVASADVDRREVRTDSRPRVAKRKALFRSVDGFEACRVLTRSDFSTRVVQGPCLVEDSNTTFVIPPGWSVTRTGRGGDLLARRDGT
jgi:N-methylhydantoinase A